ERLCCTSGVQLLVFRTGGLRLRAGLLRRLLHRPYQYLPRAPLGLQRRLLQLGTPILGRRPPCQAARLCRAAHLCRAVPRLCARTSDLGIEALVSAIPLSRLSLL